MNNNANEQISLTLPVNAAYVSAARLTASSIANRIGFDIEEIEDIKAAVSEAATYIIKHFSSDSSSQLRIIFSMSDDFMNINIIVESTLKPDVDSEDMGIMMIRALTDEFSINSEDENMTISMSKVHKEIEL